MNSIEIDRDPSRVEERSLAEQEKHKVYKRRWLVLFAIFSVNLVVGLNKCIIPIADILDSYLEVDIGDYKALMQVSIYTMIFSVLVMARAADFFGIRRIAYLAGLMILCANGLKALFCLDGPHLSSFIKTHRFHILILSEVFVGLAQSIAYSVPAKIAGSWFADYENTLAIFSSGCGLNIGITLSNYFTPLIVSSKADIHKLSYMFIISGFMVALIILTCITRSSPKIPPSPHAMQSSSIRVPLRRGLFVLATDKNYLLLLVTYSMNGSAMGATQNVLEDILKAQGYTNNFCGTIIAHSYFFGFFFTLMGASWVDNSANFVRVSRIAGLVCGLGIATFNMSIILPNIKDVIIATNIMASFGSSLMFPAFTQVALRGASTILTEPTVSAIILIQQQLQMSIFMNLLSPLEKISTTPGGYQAPMIIFACLLITINFVYITSFKPTSQPELQRRLRDLDSS